MEEVGAMNQITHNPPAPSLPIAVYNAQWNDNLGVECPTDFAGVQVHLCLKDWQCLFKMRV